MQKLIKYDKMAIVLQTCHSGSAIEYLSGDGTKNSDDDSDGKTNEESVW